MIDIAVFRVYGTPNGRFLAYADVLLGGAMLLREVRIIQADPITDDPMVRMPARRLADGTWVEYYHPMNRLTRVALEDAVRAAYKAHVGVA